MPEEEKGHSRGNIPSIRTLKTDIDEYAKSGVSLVELAGKQAKEKGISSDNSSVGFDYKKYTVIFFVFVIVLISGGVSFYFYQKQQSNAVNISILEKPILVSEASEKVVLNSNNIQTNKKLLLDKIKSPASLGDLIYIPVVYSQNGVEKNISTNDLFKIISVNPPVGFLDSMDGKFMLSKFYTSKNWPILIVKINDYNLAFSSTIKWEKNMVEDLSKLLSISNRNDASFTDRQIQSRDVRELRNSNNDVVLIYAYINRKYLVITTGEEPLKEIFRRFSFSQYING